MTFKNDPSNILHRLARIAMAMDDFDFLFGWCLINTKKQIARCDCLTIGSENNKNDCKMGQVTAFRHFCKPFATFVGALPRSHRGCDFIGRAVKCYFDL